ncbi:putative serine/threonine-protein kinase isoform X2 [Cinnamomum micranthum f. kanehirae]|uniref:non-specific serine/threonine protein kinase n=1 Tax=Cinnamomum micranthum f. kanehirae TaxID=337451 RepID=A0A3S4NIX2_9MAGN|nr:putative serine/threonine-protein kinase isoform X2 [Cinnamomum micranthum f. kanehirae]
MWRLKQFMPKEQTGLEGRSLEIGNIKVHVRNAIAEGGFSCVYLARDAVHSSKQYALKHMICNDDESLDLVKKEISVMKLLKGHPNVVLLHAHSIFDMGRTKEALLVMEFCEKSLVSVLENRGAGYFEEKRILLIFRDICNAVFAMHCHSPPIAHRDLKAENVLLGPDGAWKLCDFGSTSTNHKRFDRPEEMGVEEDNIRKHTTPAYRAPEMWDLFRKETISEKVDIWALGCLLYRICYLKSAFDGESKLQILNGNYRIPDIPRYSSLIVDLIRDMLQASPDARPDITQVWFRVNEQLPLELQKHTPDGSTSMTAADLPLPNAHAHDEGPLHAKKTPQRAPPPPPSVEQLQNVSPSSLSIQDKRQPKCAQGTPKASGGGAPLGVFWSTQHAKDSQISEDGGPVFDEGPTGESTVKNVRQSPDKRHRVNSASPPEGRSARAGEEIKMNMHGKPMKIDADRGIPKNEAFNTFVADFDGSKLNSVCNKTGKEGLEAEVERLKEQLMHTYSEKTEITSKYEKLSAICRSQRQEIQELKHALSARTPSPNKDSSKMQSSPGSWHGTQQREKTEGSVWELQQGTLSNSSPSPDSKPWKAFIDEPKVQPLSTPRSVRTTNVRQNKKAPVNLGADAWGFGEDSFTAAPASSPLPLSSNQGSNSQRLFSNQKTVEIKEAPQPAGWAGF